MISKRIAISSFVLMFLIALTALGGEIERNPKEAYFEVGKDETRIKEWLVIGPFPNEMEVDFLQAHVPLRGIPQSGSGEANIRPYEGMTVTAPDGGTYTWKRYQAQDRYSNFNLYAAMTQLLFRMEMAFQNELGDDDKRPSADLRQAFEKNGVSLSEDATISIDEKGSRWAITDGHNHRWYRIVKVKPESDEDGRAGASPAPTPPEISETKSEEEGQLDVYIKAGNAVVYAACTLLSPKTQRLEMVLGKRNTGAKAWLNGRLVHSNPIAKPIIWIDLADRFGISANKGVNTCLIKVGQHEKNASARGALVRLEVLNHDAYLRSLEPELSLTVRRQKPDGRETLTISARRHPVSTVFKLPSLPVQVEIRNEAAELLATLKAREGESVVWTVPKTVHGNLRILASQTDRSGTRREAQFICRARNTARITPRVGHWETYDTTDGLAGPQVQSIVQDRNGAIWFATYTAGVTRYDGRVFKTFTTKDGLPLDDICTIFEDSKGILWFGTIGVETMKGVGVCRYDGSTFETLTTKDGLVGDTVIAIYEDDRGHLWFGAREGVSEFDGVTFQNYTEEDGLPSAGYGVWVEAITQDQQGNLWFGHGLTSTYEFGSGVTRYNGKSFKHFTRKDGLANNNGGDDVHAIMTDAEGNLWFGTNGGVSKYNGEAFQNFTTMDGLSNNYVSDLFQTKSGDMWFATLGGGVSRYRDESFPVRQGTRFQNFTTRDGLANNGVWCIATDREGDLWFGTNNGVSRYDPSVVSIPVEAHLGEVQGGPKRDSQGNLWFGLSGVGLGKLESRSNRGNLEGSGLGRLRENPDSSGYDGRYLRTFSIEDGLGGNQVRSNIYEDRQGNIWMNVWHDENEVGLTRYDGQTFQTFTQVDGLSHSVVWKIFEDSSGILWFGMGSGGGVCTYDGDKFVQVANWKEVGGWAVWDILEDRNGAMWFATGDIYGGGVCRYDGETFIRFTTADGLPSRLCHQLMEDRVGNIWVSTSGGLGRYDGEKFTAFTTDNGLPHNTITGKLFEDRVGNLWIPTSGGLSCYDGETFQTFTTADGLASNQMVLALRTAVGICGLVGQEAFTDLMGRTFSG